MTNDGSIDYKALCWKLVDCLNVAWRKKTRRNGGWHYSFEFLPANEDYLYTSGLVAQIVFYAKNCGLVAIVQSKIGGLVTKGCETPEEAFRSMVEDYLEKVSREDAQIWFNEVDVKDLPKTIEELDAWKN